MALPPRAYDLLDDGGCGVRALGVGDGDVGAVRREAFGDGGADATGTTGNEGDFVR